MPHKSKRKIVNPLQLLIDNVERGGKVPEAIREHIFEVLRRVNMGTLLGFEWDTYVLLAAKMLAYVEWCKSMCALAERDAKDEDYIMHTQNALRWQNAFRSVTVTAPGLEKLNRLRPGSKARTARAQRNWAANHKGDPNAPIPGRSSGIGRNEPSTDGLPPIPENETGWERPDVTEDEGGE